MPASALADPAALRVPATAAAAAPARRGTLWSIQYLRAFAAFGVIVFHALSGTGSDFEFGAIGIHLFFVISGFLMWTTTCDSSAGPGPFVASRVARIVPPYWIVTALTLALSLPFPGYFWQATLKPVHVAKSLLFVPQTGIEGGIYPVVYQGWTLQYEMFFYALFALTLLAVRGLRLWLLGTMIGALCTYGFFHPDPANPLVATYTNAFCLEFLAGALTARLAQGRTLPAAPGWGLFAAGWLGLWLGYWFEKQLGYAGSLATALAASAIIFGAVSVERAGALPRWGWLKYGGEASYALYLFQEIGFLAASRVADEWPVVPHTLFLVMGAVLAGLAAYRWIETPLQRRLKRRKTAPAAA